MTTGDGRCEITVYAATLAVLAITMIITIGCDRTVPEPSPSPRPKTRELSLAEVRVDVPFDYLELEREREERLRQATSKAAPKSNLELEGRRAKSGLMGGAAYVLANDYSLTLPRRMTVRDALKREADGLRQQLAAGGAEITSFETGERHGGLEACASPRMSDSGKMMQARACTLLFIRPSRRGGALGVNCMSEPSVTDCAAILDSRRFTPKQPLPLETMLDATDARPTAGLPEVSARAFAGIEFGTAAGSFRKACKNAGHDVDRFDWAREAPAVRTWFDQGRVAQCSGLPEGHGREISLGKVVQTNAIFDQDKLASLTIYLASPLERVQNQLRAAYPTGDEYRGRTIQLVNQAAKGDEIVSIGASATRVEGSDGSVTVLSRRGMDMKPLQR